MSRFNSNNKEITLIIPIVALLFAMTSFPHFTAHNNGHLIILGCSLVLVFATAPHFNSLSLNQFMYPLE